MKTLQILGLSESKQTVRTPIAKEIDGESNPLQGEQLRLFPTAVSCFGWMTHTCRPDFAYFHSRMAQHLSKPTESAWEAVVRCCSHLRGTADLCIASPIYQQDRSMDFTCLENDPMYGWEFRFRWKLRRPEQQEITKWIYSHAEWCPSAVGIKSELSCFCK